jgi:hypothetical protein
MKTVTLRTLVREPLKVKRITRAGSAVQVTERGQPLWIIHPAASRNTVSEAERIRAIDKILNETLSEPVSSISAAKIVLDSRG